jgi:hypothetical protein
LTEDGRIGPFKPGPKTTLGRWMGRKIRNTLTWEGRTGEPGPDFPAKNVKGLEREIEGGGRGQGHSCPHLWNPWPFSQRPYRFNTG